MSLSDYKAIHPKRKKVLPCQPHRNISLKDCFLHPLSPINSLSSNATEFDHFHLRSDESVPFAPKQLCSPFTARGFLHFSDQFALIRAKPVSLANVVMIRCHSNVDSIRYCHTRRLPTEQFDLPFATQNLRHRRTRCQKVLRNRERLKLIGDLPLKAKSSDVAGRSL